MFTATIATVLLATATAAAPVEARLELLPDNGHLNLRLCFSSANPHQLTYHLEVRSLGRAGTSRSRQSGKLVSGPEAQCPLNNRLSLAADSSIEATVTWAVDGEEQTPLHQVYPPAQPTSPAPPPPGSPTERQPEADELIVTANSHPR